MKKDKKDKNKGALKNVALITQLGISMITPIFLGVFIGSWIDKKVGTDGIFMLIFLFIGVGGGFVNLFKLTGAFKDKGK